MTQSSPAEQHLPQRPLHDGENDRRRTPRSLGIDPSGRHPMVARCARVFWILRMSEPRELMPPWSPEALEHLRQVEYDFHVRAFGEEMARVNFLPLEQRKAYIAE